MLETVLWLHTIRRAQDYNSNSFLQWLKPSAAKAIYCHGRPRTTAIWFNSFHYFCKTTKKNPPGNKCINRNESITTTRTAQNTCQIHSVRENRWQILSWLPSLWPQDPGQPWEKDLCCRQQTFVRTREQNTKLLHRPNNERDCRSFLYYLED